MFKHCDDSNSQSGLSDAFAGDVPLNLGLVDPIDTGPHKCPTDNKCPESVSPQGVDVKAVKNQNTNYSKTYEVQSNPNFYYT